MTRPDGVVPVAVIGIGNAMRGDDGIGPCTIGRLASTITREGVELIAIDGEATRLIDVWRDRHLAVVIDAVIGNSVPGSVRRIEPGVQGLPGWSAGTSSHAAGLAEAVELGRTLDRLPRRLVVFGVEAADMTLGAGLSPEVAAAVPDRKSVV